MLYYFLIFVSIIMVVFGIYNLFSIRKIEKNIESYVFIITSSKAYYIGATLFSLAILLIIVYQSLEYVFDIKIFSIVFFFASLFFLSFTHLLYYLKAQNKLKDYKEFFKEFEIDLNNKCQKLMLKHILSKEKDLEKIKKIFKNNKDLCKKLNKEGK